MTTKYERYYSAIAGRAINGDATGKPLQNLSDEEITRVFGPCCGATVCIATANEWRNSGHTLEELLELAHVCHDPDDSPTDLGPCWTHARFNCLECYDIDPEEIDDQGNLIR